VRALIFNAIGAFTTFVILLVIAITKFTSGAWIIVLLIPAFVWFFLQIKSHYLYVARRLGKLSGDHSQEMIPSCHTALVPVSNLHPGVLQALHYARSISRDVRACYVELGAEQTEKLKEQWGRVVPEIPLVILPSPFRSVIEPVLDYIDQVKDETEQRQMITVVIPEFVTKKWYHQFLHNQTAFFLRAYLWLKPNTVVASVRYHI
ncbi:MAG: amino acid permease, partial [Bacillota bacterium]